MTITKVWLEKEIEGESSQDGKEALRRVYTELTKPPQPKQEKILTDVDHNKAFEEIVRYYIDKKGYSPEHANEIAIKAIGKQKQKVLEQTPL